MIRSINNKGFTLIELLLAMGLFSVILVVSTAGFIGINRTYTRGVIKKQLSESIQKVNADITNVVQLQPSGGLSYFCDETNRTSPCPTTPNINVLCFSGVRYYWPSRASVNGGLYKDSNPCGTNTFDAKVQIVDPRYAVESFKITPLPNNLYQAKGVLHTTNIGALTTTDNTGNYSTQRTSGGFRPEDTKCKGSSAGSIVQTCAVEKFDFIINSRGNN